MSDLFSQPFGEFGNTSGFNYAGFGTQNSKMSDTNSKNNNSKFKENVEKSLKELREISLYTAKTIHTLSGYKNGKDLQLPMKDNINGPEFLNLICVILQKMKTSKSNKLELDLFNIQVPLFISNEHAKFFSIKIIDFLKLKDNFLKNIKIQHSQKILEQLGHSLWMMPGINDDFKKDFTQNVINKK